ncbi:hypothetical protein [Halomicrobium salinisoli]|uniref:hypothetical protein n=1 Tax=Halomicrobium salinisoli TaxID=2878391 RepID=UPI001CF04DCE|nr:hypothetical protein [Halomicrobium salinisoli]
MTWRSKAALFAIASFALSGLFSMSDSMRPPYVGYHFELAAAVAVTGVVSAVVYWEFRGTEDIEA